MRARAFLLALALAAPVACSSSPQSGVAVGLTPNIVVPDDLIGQIAKFNLQIYSTSGGIGCDTATGLVTGDVMKAMPIAQTSDISTNCPSGVTRCATLTGVKFQTTQSVLSVTGFGSDGTTTVAAGCAEAMINQSSLTVSIKLVRVLPTENCGDGIIQPKETCDDTTAVCPCHSQSCPTTTRCQTVEELLSYGDGSNGTTTGSSGQKSNPFFVWNATSDPVGALVALYTDTSLGIKDQIGLRLMDASLSPPMTSEFGMAASQSSLFLPNCSSGCSTLPPPETANNEKQPAAAYSSGFTYVVFTSDQPQKSADAADIWYGGFSQSASLMALPTCPVNTPAGNGKLANTAPSVAANGSTLFVAWQDSNGNVSGRALTPSTGSGCGTQGTETDGFGGNIGSSTTGPKVAGIGTGWAVVWPSGSTVELQLFDASGKPQGGAQTVGSGSNPAIASVPGGSGEFAVAWAGGKGVQVQRYKGGKPVSSMDATAAVNTTSGSVSTPAIAAGSSSAGAFYVVTWIDGGNVRARLISATSGQLGDASGYLFNTVDGTANDFPVNVNTDRSPQNPTVAVGGNGGSYIAFGWEDHGMSCTASTTNSFPGTPCFGIVARRFPAPTQ